MTAEPHNEIDNTEKEAFKAQVENLFAENARLAEGLNQVAAMFRREDGGWLKLGEWNDDTEGMTLDQLKEWSEELREALAGNAHIKRGAGLRSTYVWDGGIHYQNVPGKKQGRGTNVQAYINSAISQKYFFGDNARLEREKALYTDSLYVALGDNSSKTIDEVIPLKKIGAIYRNPANDSEIWAYRKDWTEYPNGAKNPVAKKLWYFVDTFYSKRTASIINGSGEAEPVSRDHTAFDLVANTQIGWPLGVPDALAALNWARMYRDFLLNGKIMSDSLATFAFRATVGTQTGADNVGMKVNRGGVGQTAITGLPNELVPMSSAGKAYDFDAGRALAAVMATALDVSVIHINSDPGTAGSSYGSAQTLDLPTRLAVTARRSLHKEFDLRVLRWMGAPDATAWFIPLVDPAEYLRSVQAIIAKWNTGLYEGEDVKRELEGLVGKWEEALTIPDGVLLPNNEKSLARKDVDADGTAGASTGGPGQGQSTGAGGTTDSNDLRSDTLT